MVREEAEEGDSKVVDALRLAETVECHLESGDGETCRQEVDLDEAEEADEGGKMKYDMMSRQVDLTIGQAIIRTPDSTVCAGVRVITEF